MNKRAYNLTTTGLLLFGLAAAVVPQAYPQFSGGAMLLGLVAAVTTLAIYVLRRRENERGKLASGQSDSLARSSLGTPSGPSASVDSDRPSEELSSLYAYVAHQRMADPFRRQHLAGAVDYGALVRHAHAGAVRSLFVNPKLGVLNSPARLASDRYAEIFRAYAEALAVVDHHTRKVPRTVSTAALPSVTKDVLGEFEAPKEIEISGVRIRVGTDGVISIRPNQTEPPELARTADSAMVVPPRHRLH